MSLASCFERISSLHHKFILPLPLNGTAHGPQGVAQSRHNPFRACSLFSKQSAISNLLGSFLFNAESQIPSSICYVMVMESGKSSKQITQGS